mgnify:CR=1 FL=1
MKNITKKDNTYICVWNGTFQILKRVLNELYAADVYHDVFGLETLKYFIYHKLAMTCFSNCLTPNCFLK